MHFLGKLSTTGMSNVSKHQNATLAKLMQSLLRTNTLQDECMMSNIMLLRISQHKLMNKKTKNELDTIMSNNLPFLEQTKHELNILSRQNIFINYLTIGCQKGNQHRKEKIRYKEPLLGCFNSLLPKAH